MKSIQNIITTISFFFLITLTGTIFLSCGADEPKKENVPELITQVKLIFTPQSIGDAVIVTATDPDGDGIQDIQVDGSINLSPNTVYELSLELINQLADPSDPDYNITEEIEEEGDEHLFFFSWTNDVFSDPTGNGNYDNRDDVINYNDNDVNGFPIGLSTTWTTVTPGSGVQSGSFRIVLKHQPELKSSTSDAGVGETDLDIAFEINIQ